MSVLICNAISTGSWNSPQENDSRQMIVKSGEKKWDVVTAAKISLIKVMFSLQSCSAGVPSLATTKPSKKTGVMPWSKQDVLQSCRLVCVLIALLLSLISSHFAGSIPISPLCLTTVPSLLPSVHGKHSISSEPYHVSVEALSYTCDSDLVIAILFIILHYHKYSRCHHGTEMKITLKISVHCLQREGSWDADIYIG